MLRDRPMLVAMPAGDTFDASFSPSGAFIVIDVPSRGMVAKVAAR